MQRVAITAFGAHSFFDGIHRFWSPATDWRGQTDEIAVEPLALLQNIGLKCGNQWQTDPERVAVCIGSSKGDTASWDKNNSQILPSPDWFAVQAARETGARGPILAPVAACATGAHALALGAQLIQDGRAEIAIVGAVEPPQPPLVLAAYKNMGALSKTGQIRPFDRRRDGFVAASGAGFLVLESEAFAQKRGATIYGFLTGWSLRCDATHMTKMTPSGATIARAIEDALKRAKTPKIGYINAHGTATKLNDAVESRALESVFGRQIPVSSTKPLTGHLLGAAGAVEAVLSALSLKNGFAPPTLNLHEADETLNLDYISLRGRALPLEAVLSLNYGFGGHIGALILERADESEKIFNRR